MSDITVRKLRRISGERGASYYLKPPLNWLETVEKQERKKVLYLAVKAEYDNLILNPLFENPPVEAPHYGSPEEVMAMLRKGTVSKLRDIHKGGSTARIINIPRAWVHTLEKEHNSTIVDLRLTVHSRSITVEPIFKHVKPR